jgi:hypothetical protein
MNVIQPVSLGDSALVSSSIAEQVPLSATVTNYNLWVAATSYALNAPVCWVYMQDGNNIIPYGTYFGIFTSKYASNANREPQKTATYGTTLPGSNYWTPGQSAPAWSAASTYSVGIIVGRVNGATGTFYQSLAANNTGNDPISASAWWRAVSASAYAEYAPATTYANGEQVCVTSGDLASIYTSLQAANLANTPAISPTWWRYEGDGYKEWSSSATYALGALIQDSRTHHVYESAAASNLNHDPTVPANLTTWWLDHGATNRWAMFDQVNSTQSVATNSINAIIALPSLCDTLALSNMRAAQVYITARRVNAVNRNLLTYAEQFDNAIWIKQASVTVTANAVTAPDGSVTGDQVNWSSAAAGAGIYQSGIAITGAANTKSVWVKAAVAGGTIELCDQVATVAIKTVTLTTRWQRVTLSDIAGSQPANGGLWLRKTASSPTLIYVWGAQLELAAAVTPYQKVDSAYSGMEALYVQDFNLVDNSYITDYRHYFFDPLTYASELILNDLPLYQNVQLTIIATLAGGTVKIGTAVIGLAKYLGVTIYGAEAGILNYSQATTDAYGNTNFVKRTNSKLLKFKIICDNAQKDSVYSYLTGLLDTPAVFQGTGGYSSTWAYGFYSDFIVAHDYVGKSTVSLEVKGLT